MPETGTLIGLMIHLHMEEEILMKTLDLFVLHLQIL